MRRLEETLTMNVKKRTLHPPMRPALTVAAELVRRGQNVGGEQ